MSVLFSAYGSRKGVEPVEGLAVRLWAAGAQLRVWMPSDWAAAGRSDALVATAVMPNGVWR